MAVFYVVLYIISWLGVSEEHAASIFRVQRIVPKSIPEVLRGCGGSVIWTGCEVWNVNVALQH